MEQARGSWNGSIYISQNDVLLWLLMVFLTFPHFKPPYLEQIAIAELIINCWRMASFIIIFIWLLAVQKKVSLIAILIGMQQFFLLFTTVIHKGEMYNCVATLFSVMSIVLLYDLALAQEERDVFLSAQLFCFELVIYINLLTELLFPQGLYMEKNVLFIHHKNWFLGYYNNHTKYFIPALMFAFLYAKKSGKRLRIYLLTGAIFLSAFLAWSGGVILSLFIMALFFALQKKKQLVNYYACWSIHILFLLMIYLKFYTVFQWFVEGILNKWHSLIVRITLWGRIIEQIGKSPILGHGVKDYVTRATEVDYNHGIHAHNQLLELLYQGGIVGLGLWIIVVIVAGTAVYRYRNTEESKIISVAFLGWCVATLVEPFTSPFFMGMFVVAYRSNSEIVTVEGDASGERIPASVQEQE